MYGKQRIVPFTTALSCCTQEHWIDPRIDKDRIKVMHESSVHGVDDMIQLGDLSEAGIMHNVGVRYKGKEIYVRSLIINFHDQLLSNNNDQCLDLHRIYPSCS